MDQKRWTEVELMELAASRGFVVTARQIERWRKADLLPRPTVEHLGKAHGTASFYPAGTDEYLLGICALKAAGKGRPFERLMFELWWLGYEIPPKKTRDSILAMLDPIRESMHHITTNDVSHEISALVHGSDRTGLIPQLRQALQMHPDEFSDLLYMMLGRIQGSGLEFDEQIDHVLGKRTFANSLNDAVSFDGVSSPPAESTVWGDTLKIFLPYVFELLTKDPVTVLERVSDEQLSSARAAARSALEGMPDIGDASKRLNGKDIAGLRIARKIRKEVEPPANRAFQVLLFASCELMTVELLAQAESTTPVIVSGIESLERMVEAVPELKGFEGTPIDVNSLSQDQLTLLQVKYRRFIEENPVDQMALEAYDELK